MAVPSQVCTPALDRLDLAMHAMFIIEGFSLGANVGATDSPAWPMAVQNKSARGDLDEAVQLGDGRCIGHQQPTLHRGADPAETDGELVDRSGIGGRHTAPRNQTTGQGAVPSEAGRGQARPGDQPKSK
jgi:hypothetical protein